MLAFEIFGLRPPPDPSKIPSSLEKLRVTFKLREPMEELVEQFHDFQKYAIHMDQQHGALDSFECWKQSILKVGAGRARRRQLHPLEGITALVARLGALRGQM